ncbi:hypothetical protein KI387_039299, partial [Taxus chinensis]
MVYAESSELMECRVVSDVSLSISCGMEEHQKRAADLEGILCMQGGEGDVSYARNSEAPASAIALSKPFLRRAIDEIELFSSENSLCIADLGCATGANTISTVDFLVEHLKQRYRNNSISPPEFEAFFSDLPSNDFNTLFRSLPPRKENGKKKKKKMISSGNCVRERKRSYYAAGVPGSFYERLFARRKLHVVISLSALHWMSRIPEAVLDKDSFTYNRGRAWIDGAPKQVVEAYAKQSEEDLNAFLACRAEEMISGGLLFLLMAGRNDCEKPENQLGDSVTRAKHPFADSMDHTWNDLLKEGLVDEETRDTFNIPVYMRSRKEIRQAFDDSNAFDV